MELSKSEIARYLGYKNTMPDETVLKIIDECILKLSENIDFKIYSKLFDLKIDDNLVRFGGEDFESKKLASHLNGCEKCVLFGATLGLKADFLITSFSKKDMSKSVVMQAVAATILEKYCDEFENKVSKSENANGYFLRPRFSPGYGDFSLSYQPIILKMLDSQRRLGITLTESFMLIPTKSVTAIIGLTKDKTKCFIQKCMLCEKKDCPFRKE